MIWWTQKNRRTISCGSGQYGFLSYNFRNQSKTTGIAIGSRVPNMLQANPASDRAGSAVAPEILLPGLGERHVPCLGDVPALERASGGMGAGGRGLGHW